MLDCRGLDWLIARQVIAADQENLSPLHRLGRLTEFARELAQLRKAEESTLGGSVFYSCASQVGPNPTPNPTPKPKPKP